MGHAHLGAHGNRNRTPPRVSLLFQPRRQLGEIISNYWINFAKKGDPNGQDATNWPVYDAARDAVIEFGDQVSVKPRVNAAGLDFFDDYNRSLRLAVPVTNEAK